MEEDWACTCVDYSGCRARDSVEKVVADHGIGQSSLVDVEPQVRLFAANWAGNGAGKVASNSERKPPLRKVSARWAENGAISANVAKKPEADP
jgi:hypothetical protein